MSVPVPASRRYPPECDPGMVERRFGILGCRTDGDLLRSVMRMDSPSGQQAGALGVFVDHVMGEKFYTAAAPGQWALTTELAFDLLVVPPWRTSALHAAARVVAGEATGGFGWCEVTDDRGRRVATATTWLQYVPGAEGHGPEAGLAVSATGPVPPDYLAHLGARLTVDGDDSRIDLADAGRWGNDYGVLHGGIWAGLSERAAADAFARRGALRTTHVHVRYLRPSAAGRVFAVARPVHIGRSFGVAEVSGFDGSGRLCVTATVTGRQREEGSR